MLTLRHIIHSLLLALLFTIAALLIDGAQDTHVFAQQSSSIGATERERGIQLYHRGDVLGAIATLSAVVKKNPDDLIAWDHLVLALNARGKKNEARKAMKQVADLRLKRFQKEFDAISDKISDANISGIELLHTGAFISVNNYLEVSSNDEEIDWWKAFNILIVQGEFLKLAREALMQGKAIRWSEVPREKVRVLMKPEPAFTAEARQNHVSGKVVIKAVLAADGKIKDIRVLSGLSYGLTEAAFEAARRIRFRPATVGGRPVTQYWQIEYIFNR